MLVLHTHASEGYLPKGTAYIQGDIGKATYSKEQSQNVLAVGKTLCDTLNKKGITAIGSNAFRWMQAVSKVSLGATVQTIGENAFHFCTSLTSIKLPAALKNLAESAFAQVPLENITVSSDNKYFIVEDGVLFN